MRHERNLLSYDLERLAQVSNGTSGILRYAARFRAMDTSDIPNHDCYDHEEIIEETGVFNPDVPAVSQSYEKAQKEHGLSLTLKELCSAMEVSADSIKRLSIETATQSSSVEWFEKRKGRVTASIMNSVVRHVSDEGIVKGALKTVVGNIMGYTPSFTSAACDHGITNECKVRLQYKKLMSKTHKKFSVTETGMHLSLSHPFIAASPDGLVTCLCCGDGLLEVKSPWTDRFLTTKEYLSKNHSLIVQTEGTCELNKEHTWFTQIQTQIFCTNRNYCDLVVGLMSVTDNIFIQRVMRDTEFIQNMVFRASIFYEKIILEEFSTQAIKSMYQ